MSGSGGNVSDSRLSTDSGGDNTLRKILENNQLYDAFCEFLVGELEIGLLHFHLDATRYCYARVLAAGVSPTLALDVRDLHKANYGGSSTADTSSNDGHSKRSSMRMLIGQDGVHSGGSKSAITVSSD